MLNISLEEVRKNPIYKGTGCTQCQGTGYKGRMAVFEMVEMNNEIRELAFSKATTTELRKAAVAIRDENACRGWKNKNFQGSNDTDRGCKNSTDRRCAG